MPGAGRAPYIHQLPSELSRRAAGRQTVPTYPPQRLPDRAQSSELSPGRGCTGAGGGGGDGAGDGDGHIQVTLLVKDLRTATGGLQ